MLNSNISDPILIVPYKWIEKYKGEKYLYIPEDVTDDINYGLPGNTFMKLSVNINKIPHEPKISENPHPLFGAMMQIDFSEFIANPNARLLSRTWDGNKFFSTRPNGSVLHMLEHYRYHCKRWFEYYGREQLKKQFE